MSQSLSDARFMRRAIQLSKKGYPAPNPHVGCVIVKNGLVIGEGYHDFAGGLHAEAVAIANLTERANGAEVFVTLEPCAHHGKTPPCAAALIQAGVSRVVYAIDDPNPIAGGGASHLRSHGIHVESGLLAEEAATANEVFLKSFELRRPFITLKAACSLDGKVALSNGESQWLTHVAARKKGHQLRAKMGAVLVGASTVLKDDPKLTARISGVKNQPLRFVIDPKRRTSPGAKLFEGGLGWRIVLGKPESDFEIGVDDLEVTSIVRALDVRGVRGLLVEGGGETIGRFLRASLFDRVELFYATVFLGEGISIAPELGFEHLYDIPRLELIQVKRLGKDIQVSLRRQT